MYHSRWKGSHYNAGLQYGKTLFNNGVNPMKNIPINQERKDFVSKCIPLCAKVYPEILEEMKGMAEGLQINYTDIANFIFSMYCFIFDNKCSCFAFSKNGKTILGRNSDFIVSIEKLCDSTYYKLDNCYSFIGNTTAWTEMEDGVNEHGLAIGLTFIYPTEIKPGLNAGILLRYILEKCKTTKEAIYALKNLPISSPQTITLADRMGDLAVVECNFHKVIVIRPKNGENFVYTTNHFNSPEMESYKYNGPDECHSGKRFETLKNAFENEKELNLQFAKDLLSGKKGFMCQYDRKKGLDTVWSSIFDLSQNKIYRVSGNPSRKQFKEDTRLAFYKKI